MVFLIDYHTVMLKTTHASSLVFLFSVYVFSRTFNDFGVWESP